MASVALFTVPANVLLGAALLTTPADFLALVSSVLTGLTAGLEVVSALPVLIPVDKSGLLDLLRARAVSTFPETTRPPVSRSGLPDLALGPLLVALLLVVGCCLPVLTGCLPPAGGLPGSDEARGGSLGFVPDNSAESRFFVSVRVAVWFMTSLHLWQDYQPLYFVAQTIEKIPKH